MSEPRRTRKQIEADYADNRMFVLIEKLEWLAEKHREPAFNEVAQSLRLARPKLRLQMHPHDVENTR
jgi:hypothetical protein